MTFILVAFTRLDGSAAEIWMRAATDRLDDAAAAARNMCLGYNIGTGRTAMLMTVTRIEPDADILSATEARAALGVGDAEA